MFLNPLRAVYIFLLLVTSISALAQNRTVKKSNQQWVQYYAQLKLNDKFTLLSDAGYHVADNFQTSIQYIIRVGVNYTMNANIQAGAGFAHVGYYNAGKINKVEFRPYEEIVMKNKAGIIDLNNRLRIEERIFNPVVAGSIKGPNTFNFRFRYAFIAGVSLFNLSNTNNETRMILNVGDEVFFNAGKTIVYNIFDQNRILVSPTVQFNKNFAVSLTYNYQFAATSTAATFNRTNVVWLQVKQKFNAQHKKQ